MIETQIQLIERIWRKMEKDGKKAVSVARDAFAKWNEDVQKRLRRTIWLRGGCTSWYLHPKTGRNSTLWPGFTWQFYRRARALSFDQLEFADPIPQPAREPGPAPLRKVSG